MMQWFGEHQEIWVPIAIASAGGMAGFAFRQLWRIYKAFDALFSRVNMIHSQVLPNGGSSMSDRLDKTQACVTVVQNTVSTMSQRGARVAAMMETLADISDVPQFRTDETGGWNYVNRAFCELTGRSIDRMHGQNGINVVAPQDRQRVADEWDAAVDAERDLEADYLVIAADQSLVPVRCRAAVFRDEATDKFLGYTGRLEVLHHRSTSHH